MAMTIPTSRNPKQNYNINPKQNYNINPIHNYCINPIHNHSINPMYNYSINPLHNNRINPEQNHSINPLHNDHVNPEQNYSINPEQNNRLSPIYNYNIPGWYIFNKVGNYQGFTVNTKDNNFIIEYDKRQNLKSFWVKRGTGYSIFSWTTCEYIGYAENDGVKGYNIFDIGGIWIGYLR